MARHAEIATPVEPATAEIRTLAVPAGETIPNNPEFPIIIAPNALGGAYPPHAVEMLFAANGWGGTWTWQVFDYHHFHPDAFEVLAVAAGSARLMLGGPQGEEVAVGAGDVLLLPPGAGHKQIDSDGAFQICGGYPPGQEDYAVIRDSDGYDAATLDQIGAVRRPVSDPIWGEAGPLIAILTRQPAG